MREAGLEDPVAVREAGSRARDVSERPAPCGAAEGRTALLDRTFHLERLGQAGLLASGVVHDVRNMLTAIAGTCQLTLLADDSYAYRAGLEKANALAMRSAETMEVFLRFARLHGTAGIVCRLSDLVTDALRFVAPVVSQGRVVVERRLDLDVAVRAERTLLLQAVVNLLLHRVRARVAPAGRVVVTVRQVGAEAALEVADDGPESAESAAGDPFQTPRGPSSAHACGTGTGLSLARAIVEELGGRVSHVARRGLGSAFTFYLPAEPAEVSPDAAALETDR